MKLEEFEVKAYVGVQEHLLKSLHSEKFITLKTGTVIVGSATNTTASVVIHARTPPLFRTL